MNWEEGPKNRCQHCPSIKGQMGAQLPPWMPVGRDADNWRLLGISTRQRMPAWTDDYRRPDEPPLRPDVLSISPQLLGVKAGGRKTLNGPRLLGIEFFLVLPSNEMEA